MSSLNPEARHRHAITYRVKRILPMMGAVASFYLLRRSWDEIAARRGLVMTPDYIHLRTCRPYLRGAGRGLYLGLKLSWRPDGAEHRETSARRRSSSI